MDALIAPLIEKDVGDRVLIGFERAGKRETA